MRDELVLRTRTTQKGLSHTLSDPTKSIFFEVQFLQYIILRFFLSRRATAQEASEYLSVRIGAELEPTQIEHFMDKIKERGLLEPDRKTPFSIFTRYQTSRKLRHDFKILVSRNWSREKPSEEEKELVSNIFWLLRKGDLFEALKQAEMATKKSPEKKLPLLFHEKIREAIVRNQEAFSERGKHEIFITRIPLWNPTRILEITKKFISFLFSFWGLLCVGTAAILATTIYRETSDFWVGDFFFHVEAVASYPLMVFAVHIVSTIVHEFSHAATCHHFGGKVRNIGFIMFLGFIPGMYADVTDIYYLTKYRRIAVLAAGAFGQLILWVLATIIWFVTEPNSFLNLLAYFFILLNGTEVLGNLLPLGYKTDGYYILVELLDEENLFFRSFAYAKNVLLRMFTPSIEPLEKDLPRWKKFFMILYALSLTAPMVVALPLGIYMTIRMFHVFAYWMSPIFFMGPIIWTFLAIKGIGIASKWIWTHRSSTSFKKLFTKLKPKHAVVILFLLVPFFPTSMNIRSPAHIVPAETVDLYAHIDGSIREIHIKTGEAVKKGDLLISLENPDLEKALKQTLWKREKVRATSLVNLFQTLPGEKRIEELRLESAQKKLEYAQANLKRIQKAFFNGVVSEENLFQALEHLEHASANYEVVLAQFKLKLSGPTSYTKLIEESNIRMSQIDLRQLQAKVKNLQVFSPIDGVILPGNFDEMLGKHVMPGEHLVSIGTHEVTIEAFVSENDVAKFHLFAPTRFIGKGDRNLRVGRVDFISTHAEKQNLPRGPFAGYSLFPEMSAVKIRSNISPQESSNLLVGMTGRVEVDAGTHTLFYVFTRDLWKAMKFAFWKGL